MQPHQAVTAAQIVPVILTGPALDLFCRAAAPRFLACAYFNEFSPTLRTAVLRL
jgi:hypothetical protein